MHKFFKSTAAEFIKICSISLVITCASSVGGPGWNFGEHNAESSTLGTIKPQSGVSTFGVVNSCNKRYFLILRMNYI